MTIARPSLRFDFANAPGFIDPHTHFDVQLLWDGAAKPALEHGVTCIVPGNCSLSLAPIRAPDRQRVVGVLAEYLGVDDDRVARVLALPPAE